MTTTKTAISKNSKSTGAKVAAPKCSTAFASTATYGSELFYFQNPTYRNPERMVDAALRMNTLEKEKLAQDAKLTLLDFHQIVNSDIAFASENNPQRSYDRKRCEINKLNFITLESDGNYKKQYDIDKLQPTHTVNMDSQQEWKSNIVLYALAQRKQLGFFSELITATTAAWKNKNEICGNRQGVLEYELIYLRGWLKKRGPQTVAAMVKEIITLRCEFKNNKMKKKGREKDFWSQKIETEFDKKFFNSSKDYIDALLRTLTLTKCFVLKRHSFNQEDKFAMRILQLNTGFADKLNFFVGTTLDLQKRWVKAGVFSKNLYDAFNVQRAYDSLNKELNEVIQKDPHSYLVDKKSYLEATKTWYGHEFDTSLLALQYLKSNDMSYSVYPKAVAIKMEDGAAYAGTTSGVADCYVVMPDIVATVEATTLRDGFQQCAKEYIPNKSHVEKLLAEHSKKLGLSVFVAPSLSAAILKEFVINNYAQSLLPTQTWLVAFNKKEYLEFLECVNTNDKWVRFATYVSQIDAKEYFKSQEGNPFYEALQKYKKGPMN